MVPEPRIWRPRWFATVFCLSMIVFLLTFNIIRDMFSFAVTLVSGYSGSQPLTAVGQINTGTFGGMKRLRFKDDGTFQIGVFEDLHFGEGEDNPPEWGWGPLSDLKSVAVIESILDSEKLDLAVLNGDLITGENTYLENATHYLDQIVEPLVSRNVPWASTYGNHDQQFNLSSERLLQRERTHYPSLSYTRSMITSEAAGVSNYVLPIYSSKGGEDAVPALLLWFFDSKGGSKFQEENPTGKTPDERRVPIADYVDPSVVEWFVHTNAQLVHKYKRKLPSFAFVHIPIFAMAAFQKQGVDPHRQPGINDDEPLSPQSVKSNRYTAKDVPFMQALIDMGVRAVFSGHDHGDDWCFRWNSQLVDMTLVGNGLFVCFGRHTGYGGYGSWIRGSRQILLHEDTLEDEASTWIRLEDQTLSGAVVLNDTYGTDVYPVARFDHSH